MTLPTNAAYYKEERRIWQATISAGGMTIRCGTPNKAVQMLQRLHMCRTLDRRNSFDGKYTVFDDYIVRHPARGTEIVIEKRAGLGDIELVTPAGTPPDLDQAQREIDDLDNYKSDEYLRDIGLDPSQINPDAPLDLE